MSEEKEIERCPGCLGAGRWESECCSGYGGCSCRGDTVDMGTCLVCGGQGWIQEGEADRSANIKSIEGLCYLGSGPR